MIKQIWDFYLSPEMGWIIYGSFAYVFFPAGSAQGAAVVIWIFCMELAIIRSVLLLFAKEKQKILHWYRGFWIGILAWMGFLLLWLFFGNGVWSLWAYPILAWNDLEHLMFVR